MGHARMHAFAQGIVVRRRPDDEILTRAMNNDPVAFSEFYRRYRARVYGFCLSRLMSADAAAEATQEVFVRILSATPGTVRNPTSWLFGVARHVCIDSSRRDHSLADASSEHVLDDAPSTQDTESAVLGKRSAENILLALSRLKPRYRSALILREIHQQPMRDVAQALGVSVPTAYVVLSRSRDAFGKAYAQLGDMNSACRTAVELIHRRAGTGIGPRDSSALEAHLTECEHCRREARTATEGSGMRAALLLLPAVVEPHGLVARAVSRLGRSLPTSEAARAIGPALGHHITQGAAMGAATVGVAAATIVMVSGPMWHVVAPQAPAASSEVARHDAKAGQGPPSSRGTHTRTTTAYEWSAGGHREQEVRVRLRVRETGAGLRRLQATAGTVVGIRRQGRSEPGPRTAPREAGDVGTRTRQKDPITQRVDKGVGVQGGSEQDTDPQKTAPESESLIPRDKPEEGSEAGPGSGQSEPGGSGNCPVTTDLR